MHTVFPIAIGSKYADSLGVDTLGNRIRAARKAQGISQAELARRLGVANSTTFRWEAERARPRPADLERLLEILDVTREWLVDGVGAAALAPGDPPHWAAFIENYPDIDEMTPEELSWMREGKVHARGGLNIRSWADWAQLAEWIRARKPSAIHEAKKKQWLKEREENEGG